MDEVEHLLEQQRALFRLAQPRADHDAVEALVAQCGRDAGFGGRVEIDQAARDLVAEITQAQQLRFDVMAHELRRELRNAL